MKTRQGESTLTRGGKRKLYVIITAPGQIALGQSLRAIESLEPTRPRRKDPTIPSEIEAVIVAALRKDRGARYASGKCCSSSSSTARISCQVRFPSGSPDWFWLGEFSRGTGVLRSRAVRVFNRSARRYATL